MSSAASALPVLVVGGGIAGVATALALGRQGRKVQLLEQADQIGAIGYGVQMGPNVMPMLEQLGVADAVKRAAFFPTEILLYDLKSGEKLADIPLQTEAFDKRYGGFKYIAIHRVDLHELLLAACRRHPSIDLNESTAVTGYVQGGGEVAVTAGTGRTIAGAAVIAADGLRSRLRAQMHPEDRARETGYVAHRAIVPMAQAPAACRQRSGVAMWAAGGFHVIYYPLRDRTELNIVVVVKVPADVDPTDNQAYRAHLDAIMAAAQPEAREVIALVNLERRWSIADRNPVRQWADGKVLLIGDSAHATLQSFAQGAGMGIEDAACLGAILEKRGDDYEAAFKELQATRFLRTARVQLGSRTLWEEFHCDGAEAEVRSAQYRERSVDDIYRCLDWLWTPVKLPA